MLNKTTEIISDEFQRGEMVVAMQCLHCYHQDCFTGYSRRNGGNIMNCPVCRRGIAPGSMNFYKFLGRRPEQFQTPPSTPEVPRPTDMPPAGTEPQRAGPSADARPNMPASWYGPTGLAVHEGSFLVHTQLPDGRMGIIVDPGAWTNLAGGKWVRQLASKARTHHKKPTQVQLTKQLDVQGVGQGTQTANWAAHLPIAITNGEGSTVEQIFEVPTLEGEGGSDVPALLGLRSMRSKSAILEMAAGKERLTFPGEGGYTIEWSPGTMHIPLEVAPSGHYVIPCDSYEKIQQQEGGLEEEKTVLLAQIQEWINPPPARTPPPPPAPRSRQ